MYILVNDCDNPLRLLIFVTTPSTASHSGVTRPQSSNLNILTMLLLRPIHLSLRSLSFLLSSYLQYLILYNGVLE
jgi:hypothetical protein